MSKELFIEAHEELIERYLETHPEATEAEAYNKTADNAWSHMADRLGDRMDRLKDQAKEDGNWPPR